MTDNKTTIKPIVEIRSGDYNSIALKTMDFEGGTALMITTEDGGGTTSFFFDDAHELATFAKRVREFAEMAKP